MSDLETLPAIADLLSDAHQTSSSLEVDEHKAVDEVPATHRLCINNVHFMKYNSLQADKPSPPDPIGQAQGQRVRHFPSGHVASAPPSVA